MTTQVTKTKPAKAKAAKVGEPSVLFDAPGPRARVRNNILTAASLVVIIVILYLVYAKLDERGQWAADLWNPFLRGDVWNNLILPGLWNTLKAAAVGSVLALAFGAIFGLARLSDHWWIRGPAGAVVEFFRAIPLLILIFLLYFVPQQISPVIAESPFGTLQRVLVDNVFFVFGIEINQGTVSMPAFAALVFGLTLYNGSVLAEVVRAGVRAVPRGQSEAAYSIGLRKNGVMRLILLPQAVTAMMPAIISQLVVLLKDTALGFLITYEELLRYARYVGSIFQFDRPLVPVTIVVAAMYIAMCLLLTWLATYLEKRNRRDKKVVELEKKPAEDIVATAV